MAKYNSAEDAESAFYLAFEKADLDTMMSIWADHDEVVCIHPGAPRMEGVSQIRESWVQLFRDLPMLRFSLLDVRIIRCENLSIHQIREEIEIDGQFVSMMLSTNVYERDQSMAWHMTSRHSSPEPDEFDYEDDDDLLDEEDEQESSDSPYLLH